MRSLRGNEAAGVCTSFSLGTMFTALSLTLHFNGVFLPLSRDFLLSNRHKSGLLGLVSLSLFSHTHLAEIHISLLADANVSYFLQEPMSYFDSPLVPSLVNVLNFSLFLRRFRFLFIVNKLLCLMPS